MNFSERLKSENGVVLVFTAIAIIVLIGFLTFVVDYGILWVSRGEAQTSADAGALAGAIARAFDDTSATPAAGGVVEQSAQAAALQNSVWYASAGQQISSVSWTCPATQPAGVRCVRVDVFRNGQQGSSILPLVFGPVIGVNAHGVRATATARVAFGNAVNCMRPFSVADRWYNLRPPSDEFNRWDSTGNQLAGAVDWYEPPGTTTGADGSTLPTGSGYTVPADVGAPVVLKGGNNPNAGNIGPVYPGWFLPIRLPDGAGGYTSGASDFRDAIKLCIGNPVAIGDYLPTESGAMVGPTSQGVETDGDSLINQDASATWDTGTNSVANSCAPGCAGFSPRIVPISVFDFDEFVYRHEANDWTHEWIPGAPGVPGHVGPGPFSCPEGGKCIRVSNIIGFFVESMTGNDVTGRVLTYPGEFVVGPPSVSTGAAFLTVIQLIR